MTNSLIRCKKFGVQFVFLIFDDRDFAGDKRNVFVEIRPHVSVFLSIGVYLPTLLSSSVKLNVCSTLDWICLTDYHLR